MSEIIKTTVEYTADYNKLPILSIEDTMYWSRSRKEIWYTEAKSALLIANLVDRYVNSFTADYAMLAQALLSTHPTLQQNVWRLVVALAKRMEHVREDGRNQDSHRLAKQIREGDTHLANI